MLQRRIGSSPIPSSKTSYKFFLKKNYRLYQHEIPCPACFSRHYMPRGRPKNRLISNWKSVELYFVGASTNWEVAVRPVQPRLQGSHVILKNPACFKRGSMSRHTPVRVRDGTLWKAHSKIFLVNTIEMESSVRWFEPIKEMPSEK